MIFKLFVRASRAVIAGLFLLFFPPIISGWWFYRSPQSQRLCHIGIKEDSAIESWARLRDVCFPTIGQERSENFDRDERLLVSEKGTVLPTRGACMVCG